MQNKPRNPVVPAMARRSGAGAHGKSTKAARQAARNELRRSLRRGRDEAGFVQRIAVC